MSNIQQLWLAPEESATDNVFQRIDEEGQRGDTAVDGYIDNQSDARVKIGMLRRDLARNIKRACEDDAIHLYDGRVLSRNAEIQRIAEAFGFKAQGFCLRFGLGEETRKAFGFFGGIRTAGLVYFRASGSSHLQWAVIVDKFVARRRDLC